MTCYSGKRDLPDDLTSTPPPKKVPQYTAYTAKEDIWNLSRIYEIDAGNREWWKSSVVYEVYVRSFFDSNGDGIGDLRGIQEKLYYFVDIGVDTLWLSPVYTSPMKDFGYDVADFKNIDPIFGNLDDFASLLSSMKDKGLKLVMDIVPNHTSDQHEWFVKSCQRVEPYSDYYIWLPSKGVDDSGKQIVPNNWVSVFGGSMWEWNDERSEFYLHQFTKEQPDLNFRNPAVTEEIKNVLRFWLDFGVDGFRMDAVAHLFEDKNFCDEPEAKAKTAEVSPEEYSYWDHPHTANLPEVLEFLREIRQVLDEYSVKDGHPRLMMTEAYLPCKELFKYYGTDAKPIASFPFNFDLITCLNRGFTSKDIFEVVNPWLENCNTGQWPNWVLGNHDVPRICSKFGIEFVDILHMITQLLPGTSVTYNGEEIGMENTELSWEQTVDPAGRNAGEKKFEIYSRDPERTPMQWTDGKHAGFTNGESSWLPINSNYTKVNVQLSQTCDESHWQNYKKLVGLRTSKVFLNGYVEMKASFAKNVFAFSRISEVNLEGWLAVINLGENQTTIDVTGFQRIPAELPVYIRSFPVKSAKKLSCFKSSAVEVSPSSAHVLKFKLDVLKK